uniref:Jacalin-type lectin domain-containing protein n=1 Tax=Leersia perrieri TaxID=77586 RepID=A0A0D9XPF0_9ORYZ
MSVVKVGPFGGQAAGRVMDISPNQPPAQLKNIEIWHNQTAGIITAIRFTYTNDQDDTFTVPNATNVWGDQRSGSPQTIIIDIDGGEYVTKMEGTHNGSHVSSLRITTNMRPSQWFGNQSKGNHSFSVPLNKGGILAFFVRASNCINAIGVYVGSIE